MKREERFKQLKNWACLILGIICLLAALALVVSNIVTIIYDGWKEEWTFYAYQVFGIFILGSIGYFSLVAIGE